MYTHTHTHTFKYFSVLKHSDVHTHTTKFTITISIRHNFRAKVIITSHLKYTFVLYILLILLSSLKLPDDNDMCRKY